MDPMVHDEGNIKSRLAAAQAGDEQATRDVAVYVFNRFKPRLRQFYDPLDPAVSMEDLEMTFFEGILRAIPRADGRGDDLYHIGQRGVWAVQTQLRHVRRIMEKRVTLHPTEPGGDPWNDFVESYEDRTGDVFE